MKNLTITFLFCLLLTGAYAQTVKDVDGNTYKTVKIGNQVWMAENLRTTHLNDGTPITLAQSNKEWKSIKKMPAYCWYENDSDNQIIYGNLYNWYVVETEKICPVGWHVPTSVEDIDGLFKYFNENANNYDGSKEGDKFAKAMAAKKYWINPNDADQGSPGTDGFDEYQNKSGFSALPGGHRHKNGDYCSLGEIAVWWTSQKKWGFSISNIKNNTGFRINKPEYGASIRCVKDNAVDYSDPLDDTN